MKQSRDSKNSVPSGPAAIERAADCHAATRPAALQTLLPLVRLLARQCAQELLAAQDGGCPMRGTP
jgi:hypothetical protein